jgi:hypothetical protein
MKYKLTTINGEAYLEEYAFVGLVIHDGQDSFQPTGKKFPYIGSHLPEGTELDESDVEIVWQVLLSSSSDKYMTVAEAQAKRYAGFMPRQAATLKEKAFTLPSINETYDRLGIDYSSVYKDDVKEKAVQFKEGDRVYWVNQPEIAGVIFRISDKAIHVRYDNDFYQKFHFNPTHHTQIKLSGLALVKEKVVDPNAHIKPEYISKELYSDGKWKVQSAEEIASKIFYSPATNGQSENSIKEGARMIEAYAIASKKASLKTDYPCTQCGSKTAIDPDDICESCEDKKILNEAKKAERFHYNIENPKPLTKDQVADNQPNYETMKKILAKSNVAVEGKETEQYDLWDTVLNFYNSGDPLEETHASMINKIMQGYTITKNK